MPILGLDRFAHELQVATLVKGPFAPELLEAIQPVFPIGEHPEFDDRIVYWSTPQKSLAALAGNRSTVWIACASGRAIIDGLVLLNLNAAVAYVVINRIRFAGTNLPVAAFQANPFSSTATGSAVIAPLTINESQTPGGRLAGTGLTISVAPAAQGIPTLMGWRGGTAPAWVIDPTSDLVIETNTVNLALNVSVWGRWFPETLPGPA